MFARTFDETVFSGGFISCNVKEGICLVGVCTGFIPVFLRLLLCCNFIVVLIAVHSFVYVLFAHLADLFLPVYTQCIPRLNIFYGTSIFLLLFGLRLTVFRPFIVSHRTHIISHSSACRRFYSRCKGIVPVRLFCL